MQEPIALSPVRSFLWTQRALKEREQRNLSAAHLDVAIAIQKLVEAGVEQFTHLEVAGAARCCVRTVGEATRRLRLIGLIDWRAQYRTTGARRRRQENQYWLRLPLGLPVPRPDLHRRRVGGFCRAREESMNKGVFARTGAASLPPVPGFEARVAAKWAEERRLRRASWGRRL